ncbi:putative undecaprenyl diphosphate synthase-domain-containing protein [Auriculariales sp. MPI-PUGE-AT-0066]|nr:putative undecaprenyl diphosphate synthase-domain-containing protein [Auriculariales sp. MPI-PUGE-AT-0066]
MLARSGSTKLLSLLPSLKDGRPALRWAIYTGGCACAAALSTSMNFFTWPRWGIVLSLLVGSILIYLATFARFAILEPPSTSLHAQDPQHGSLLAMCAAHTALVLQIHHPLVGFAVQKHTHFTERPMGRFVRTLLFVELALHGSTEDKLKLAGWLRGIHAHVKGSLPSKWREEIGLADDAAEYGYMPELMAYVLETLTWSTIAFHQRFGDSSQQNTAVLDSIVLHWSSVGRLLGVRDNLLGNNFESFTASFQARLATIRAQAGETLRPRTVCNLDDVSTSHRAAHTWWMRAIIYCGWTIGTSLLPPDIQDAYGLNAPQTRTGRFVRWAGTGFLAMFYNHLPRLPVRGLIAIICALEPGMRELCIDTLVTIRSSDEASNSRVVAQNVDLVGWLATGPQSANPFMKHPTVLQSAVVRVVEAQISMVAYQRSQTVASLVWIGHLAQDTVHGLRRNLQGRVHALRCNLARRSIVWKDSPDKKERSIPVHVGCVMDGNRRFARSHKYPSVILGHQRGAATAADLLVWWADLVSFCHSNGSQQSPRVLTLWALSSDNLKRPQDELEGLLDLLTQEIVILANSPLVHHLRIHVRVIGSVAAMASFPHALREAIEGLESATSLYRYDDRGLTLQLAIAYGGQDEVVEAVQRVTARGEPVTAQALGRETYSARNGVPPVGLIIRTSERRTSGFML